MFDNLGRYDNIEGVTIERQILDVSQTTPCFNPSQGSQTPVQADHWPRHLKKVGDHTVSASYVEDGSRLLWQPVDNELCSFGFDPSILPGIPYPFVLIVDALMIGRHFAYLSRTTATFGLVMRSVQLDQNSAHRLPMPVVIECTGYTP